MALLDSSHFPSVRGALGPEWDDENLSDTYIELDIFLAAAEAEVLERVPGAESLTGASLTRVKNAAVYLTAARLAPRLPNITRESSAAGESYQREAVDVSALVGRLRADAEVELSTVLGETDTTMPTFFAAAPGGRGR